MKDYTYNEKEIEFIRFILKNPPKKIWWGFVDYIFEYDNFYFQLECLSELADTVNNSDEAIIATLNKIENVFVPNDQYELVCREKNITKAYIVRTFLYFTKYKEHSQHRKLTLKIAHFFKTALTFKKDSLGKLLLETNGAYSKIFCHPKSDETKSVDQRYSNIIDIGLLLEIDGKLLKAYLFSGFGFNKLNNKFFCTNSEIKEDAKNYEFIEI